ncbi:ACT domain-containing protein [uncultured Paraglaciecola sp.]|uniref:ACT domain-containing protein n=1 Tax=uncultured Paraglaciecola sp. TaxID=1765024 RepID=UPI00260E4B46|nr:ACT domain-containing protein [uncultured Paraglaciecola sp.]
MTGETDLGKLLASIQPELAEQEYVFACLGKNSSISINELAPLGIFNEKEGVTVIVLKATADALGVAYHGVFRCITLKVHSSLEAVGLTAAVSGVLTTNGISANVVAAYYHDHIFVPKAQADMALSCLLKLAVDNQ